jgi:hypothetical protein
MTEVGVKAPTHLTSQHLTTVFFLSPASRAYLFLFFLPGADAPGFTLSPASQAFLIWGLTP